MIFHLPGSSVNYTKFKFLIFSGIRLQLLGQALAFTNGGAAGGGGGDGGYQELTW